MSVIDDLLTSSAKTFREWEVVRRKNPHLYYRPEVQSRIFADRVALGEKGFYGRTLPLEKDQQALLDFAHKTEAEAKAYQDRKAKEKALKPKGPLQTEASDRVFGGGF